MQAAEHMGIVINALEYAKRLRKAGVEPDMAEALAEVLHHAAEHRLATKEDIIASETTLREEIKIVETSLREEVHRLDHKIDQLEVRLTNKIFMMTITIVTLLGGLTTVLHFY